MSKIMLIVGIVMLTVMVPLSSYGQSQAADPSKENSSPNPQARFDVPSEEELEKAKKEFEDEQKKAQEEIKKDREEREKAIAEMKKIVVGGSYNLPEDEVKRLQEQALKGSPDAAYRLWEYYGLYKKDYTKRDFWEVIAAENGHACAQYSYGVRLSMDQDPINIIRARFWLGEAAAKGDQDAISKLLEESRIPIDVSMSKETAKDLHLIYAWVHSAAEDAKEISTLPPEDPHVTNLRNWIKKRLDFAKEGANKLPDEKLRSQVLDEVKKIEASVKKAPIAREGRETENKEQGRAGK